MDTPSPYEELAQRLKELEQQVQAYQHLKESYRESSEKIRAMFETVTDGITFTDLQGMITGLNQATLRLHGYKEKADLIGRNALDLIAPRDHQRAIANLQKTLETGRSGLVEYRLLTREGQEFDAELSAVLLKDRQGNPAGFVAITRDITSRKQAETMLQAINFAAGCFLKTPDLKQDIDRVLEALGRATGVDRVSIFKNHLAEDGTLLTSQRHEWVAGGIKPELDNPLLQNIDPLKAGYSRWVDLLSRGRPVYGLTAAMPAAEQRFLKITNAVAFATVPVIVKEKWWGVINFGICNRKHQWSPAELNALQTAASMLGTAIERQQTEEVLRESEERFRSIFENAVMGLYRSTPDGRILMANPALLRMLGYSSFDELARVNLEESGFAPGYPRAAFKERIEADGQVTGFESMWEKQDGSHIAIRESARAIRDKNGNILYYDGTVEDITLQRQVEEAQIYLADQLRTAAEVGRRVTAILDPELLMWEVVNLIRDHFRLYHTHIYLLDETGEQLVVRAGSGRVGRILYEQEHKIPLSYNKSLVARAARTRQIVMVQDTSQSPDFMPNPFLPQTHSEMAVPLIAGDQLLGVLDVQNDQPNYFHPHDRDVLRTLASQIAIALQNANLFAERKRAEAEKEKLIAELEAKNAELEQFTYTVSHDLKSPLVTINGFLGLLEKDAGKGDMQQLEKDIRQIRNAAEKMQALLDDLLEMSRIGRLVNPPQNIPLDTLVRQAVALVAGQIAERGVSVVIAPNLPAVHGDLPRLLEVFQNLVDNAVKFMGNQPSPRLEIGANLAKNGSVICHVRDNGIGIEPRYHSKIFSLFERLDQTIPGTGIGLALARRIVEVHGGRIWVESDGPGHGATFYFTLPAAKPPNLQSPNPQSPQ